MLRGRSLRLWWSGSRACPRRAISRKPVPSILARLDIPCDQERKKEMKGRVCVRPRRLCSRAALDPLGSGSSATVSNGATIPGFEFKGNASQALPARPPRPQWQMTSSGPLPWPGHPVTTGNACLSEALLPIRLDQSVQLKPPSIPADDSPLAVEHDASRHWVLDMHSTNVRARWQARCLQTRISTPGQGG